MQEHENRDTFFEHFLGGVKKFNEFLSMSESEKSEVDVFSFLKKHRGADIGVVMHLKLDKIPYERMKISSAAPRQNTVPKKQANISP